MACDKVKVPRGSSVAIRLSGVLLKARELRWVCEEAFCHHHHHTICHWNTRALYRASKKKEISVFYIKNWRIPFFHYFCIFFVKLITKKLIHLFLFFSCETLFIKNIVTRIFLFLYSTTDSLSLSWLKGNFISHWLCVAMIEKRLALLHTHAHSSTTLIYPPLSLLCTLQGVANSYYSSPFNSANKF